MTVPAELTSSEPADVADEAGTDIDDEVEPDADPAGTAPRVRRPPQAASVRALRMMNVVPWIAAQDGPTIDAVCERFGLERERLLEELKVLQFVGLPPYSPDMLTEVAFKQDRVWVRLPDVFSRPLRLTPDQALGLIAAGAALTGSSAVPDEPGPLETGLAKLAEMLGIDASEAVGIQLGRSDPEILRSLRQAASEQTRVRVDYFTYGRDARNEREVDPYRVFSDSGAWYLYGHCHLAGEPRLFRLDRIFHLDVLDHRFTRPPAAEETPSIFGAAQEAPRITLDLSPAARWVVDQYPVEASEDLADGYVRVRLAISSRRWLEKLLLRLGPDARVVHSTDPALAHSGAEAAERILARYRQ